MDMLVWDDDDFVEVVMLIMAGDEDSSDEEDEDYAPLQEDGVVQVWAKHQTCIVVVSSIHTFCTMISGDLLLFTTKATSRGSSRCQSNSLMKL